MAAQGCLEPHPAEILSAPPTHTPPHLSLSQPHTHSLPHGVYRAHSPEGFLLPVNWSWRRGGPFEVRQWAAVRKKDLPEGQAWHPVAALQLAWQGRMPLGPTHGADPRACASWPRDFLPGRATVPCQTQPSLAALEAPGAGELGIDLPPAWGLKVHGVGASRSPLGRAEMGRAL